MTLRVHNWDKWQSYRRDRRVPPWIKIHRQVIMDPKWGRLSDAQKGHLVSIWILAANDNGAVPEDPKMVRKLCQLDSDPDLNLFTELGFLDAKETSRRRQRDARLTRERRANVTPELEEEIEAEEKGQNGVMTPKSGGDAAVIRTTLATVLDEEHVKDIIEHRRKLRAPLTVKAAAMLAKEFALCRDPNAAADWMIGKGYRGFEAKWMREGGTQQTLLGVALENVANEREKHGH